MKNRNLPANDLRGDEGSAGSTVLDPWMFQHGLSRETTWCLLDQQTANEILGLLRDVSPFTIGKFITSLLDAGEQKALARLASLSALPSAIGSAMAVEWRVAAEQNVHDNAKRPEIASLVISVDHLADKSIDDFWSHKFGAAHWCEQFRRRDGRIEVRVELDARTEIEITDLDRRQTVGIDAKDVFRLEVSVGDPLLVEELQAGGQVTQHQTGFVLGKVNAPLNVRQQRAAQNLLENQIETVLLFEKFNQLDYVGMSLAVVESLHFFKDAIATMARHFFDYL